MNKTYLISADSLKTMAQGALGAMTFGMYHQYTTNKMMEMNNIQMNLNNQYFKDKMEAQHKAEMDELRTKMAALERRSWW